MCGSYTRRRWQTVVLLALWTTLVAPARAEWPLWPGSSSDLENPFQRGRIAHRVTPAGGAGALPPDLRIASFPEETWTEPLGQMPGGEVFPDNCPPMTYDSYGYQPTAVFTSQPSRWYWQVMPDGLMYRSYLAGLREPRLSSVVFQERDGRWLWDTTLGGRRALVRFGTADPRNPQGWELQVEGAALIRLNLDQEHDVDSVDFRGGFPIARAIGNWQFKFGYYHLSSHLGDELIERVPGATRTNYVRDSILLGVSYYIVPTWRIYGEAAYAFNAIDGAEPWEFQFGMEFSDPGPTGTYGSPFLAVNGHLREEVDFGGDFTLQLGWLWRGETGSALRFGFHYYNGKSSQYQFFNDSEEQIGLGMWYDY